MVEVSLDLEVLDLLAEYTNTRISRHECARFNRHQTHLRSRKSEVSIGKVVKAYCRNHATADTADRTTQALRKAQQSICGTDRNPARTHAVKAPLRATCGGLHLIPWPACLGAPGLPLIQYTEHLLASASATIFAHSIIYLSYFHRQCHSLRAFWV